MIRLCLTRVLTWFVMTVATMLAGAAVGMLAAFFGTILISIAAWDLSIWGQWPTVTGFAMRITSSLALLFALVVTVVGAGELVDALDEVYEDAVKWVKKSRAGKEDV